MDIKSNLLLLVFPLQLGLQYLLGKSGLGQRPVIHLVLSLSIALLSLGLVYILKRDLLLRDLRRFRRNKTRNIITGLVTGILSFVVLKFAGDLSRRLGDIYILSAAPKEALVNDSVIFLLVSSLVPLTAPFTEELVFRHELFYKYKDRPYLASLMALVSSVLFGLLHLGNYGFNLTRTLPLMAVGYLYTIAYRLADNIWVPIIAHLFYNGLMTLGASLIIIILKIFM